MSLNSKDKEIVKIFFTKIGARGADIGAEALARTLMVYPQTKTYFSHWSDLSITSPHVRKHGGVIFNGVMDAVSKMNDLKAGLLSLSELHAFMLRVDPANFRLFINNVHIVLAITFAGEYSPTIHCSVDKFLNRVSLALSEKYR